MRKRPLLLLLPFLFAAWTLCSGEETPPAPRTTPPRKHVKPVLKPSPTPTPIVVSKNLVKNGNFEQRRPDHPSPLYWQLCDGLTTFHEKREGRGYLLRIDTTVPKEQARARWLVMKKLGVKAPPAPRKGKLKNRFDCIGAVDGVHYFSDPIPVKKGARYKFSIRHKSKTGPITSLFFPKIFVKGYGEVVKKRNIRQPDGSVKQETVTEVRQVFKWYLACRNPEGVWMKNEEWIPCPMPGNVDYVKICIYAYWPAQNYYFDDVEFYEGKDPPKNNGK